MKNNIFTFAILLISLLSCSQSDKTDWDDKTIHLEGELLNGSVLDLYTPRDIIMVDSLIIIGDINQSELYHRYLINGNNIEELSGFGKEGEGPNEFYMAFALHYTNDRLSIYNKGFLRYQILNKSDLLSSDIESYMETKSVKNSAAFHELIELENDLYFGTGTFRKGMFAFYSNDSIVHSDIPYPKDNINTINEQKGMVYQGFIAKQPYVNKIAFAGFYGQVFEIFSYENYNIKRVFSDIIELPSYKPTESENSLEANYTVENKIGYFMTSVTDKYIYALFCGKNYNDNRIDYANTIFVYDWDGNRIKKYLLDKDLSCICVNNEDSKIYGLHTDPEDDLVKIVCYNIEN